MFILASASQGRRELLKGYRFKVVPSGIREVRRPTLRATVLDNAKLKAAAVARRFPGTWVLAADTMIAYRGKIYGKPPSRKAALRLFRLLAGKTHVLATGVCLQKDGRRIVKYATSKVVVRKDPPIEKMLRSHDPTKYAGGYAIREKNDPMIERIIGSRSNVIGLPLEIVTPLLKAANLPGRNAAASGKPTGKDRR
jgi:septum formation protein